MSGLLRAFSPTGDDPTAIGCATLAAEYDWPGSDFGPRDQWDPAVDAVIRTLLETVAPMAYCHGPGYSMAYNDRFADLLAPRHPRAWAQRAALVMPEIWSRRGYAEAVDNVFAGGPSFHDDGEMLDLHGREESHPDWAYLARSYSAVRSRNGSVLGLLIVVVEVAPVLVLVGGTEPTDQGAAWWRGIELWDETIARKPLIWSGFRAGARSPQTPVSELDQRFVPEGHGQLILPINGPDMRASIGSLGAGRHLPDVQMVTLAARDENETAGTAASGEFYDVFDMTDGRAAVVIGDVTGAGVAAPAVAAQVKVALRGAALTSADPNVIFRALDELVNHLDRTWPAEQDGDPSGAAADGNVAGFRGELFVATLLGVFNPATGDLVLASAGHVSPAVVHRHASTATQGDSGPDGKRDSGRVAEYATVEPGPPLGISGARPETQMVLHRGDALVGFTHGLLKRHDQGVAEGQQVLLDTLSTMSATAARSISQHVVDSLIGPRGLEHDCAVLVVVRDNRPHQMASVLIPPHNIAVRGARRWTRAQLESWEVSDGIVTDAVMSISELVTNVVLHAGTSARVTMELADRLLVTVEDTGSWSAPRSGPENHSSSHGRGLALVAGVSDAMGYARGVEGSTVWFELDLGRAGG